MAAKAESVSVLRIVVREGLSRDMADSLASQHRGRHGPPAGHSPTAGETGPQDEGRMLRASW